MSAKHTASSKLELVRPGLTKVISGRACLEIQFAPTLVPVSHRALTNNRVLVGSRNPWLSYP